MVINHDEQAQIQNLKNFWNKYGNIILSLFIVVLVIYTIYTYWENHHISKKENSSILYNNLVVLYEKNQDLSNLDSEANKILEDYSGTLYSTLTALFMAKIYVQKNKFKEAKNYLNLVINNKNIDNIYFKDVAKIRLSRILINENDYKSAISILETDYLKSFDLEKNYFLGLAYYKNKDYKKAQKVWQNILNEVKEKDTEFPLTNLVNLYLGKIKENLSK